MKRAAAAGRGSAPQFISKALPSSMVSRSHSVARASISACPLGTSSACRTCSAETERRRDLRRDIGLAERIVAGQPHEWRVRRCHFDGAAHVVGDRAMRVGHGSRRRGRRNRPRKRTSR